MGTIRLFVIGFTKRRQNQVKATTYAQTAQIRQIRKKMADIISKHAAQSDLHNLKILKAPKFDILRLKEIHTESNPKGADTGANVDRSADEAKALEDRAS